MSNHAHEKKMSKLLSIAIRRLPSTRVFVPLESMLSYLRHLLPFDMAQRSYEDGGQTDPPEDIQVVLR